MTAAALDCHQRPRLFVGFQPCSTARRSLICLLAFARVVPFAWTDRGDETLYFPPFVFLILNGITTTLSAAGDPSAYTPVR